MANLINPASWVKVGNGTIAVNSTTSAVSVTPNADASITSAIQTIPTEVGKVYQVTWELQTSTQMWRSLGTTQGSYNITARGMSVVNENKITFTATTTSVVLEFYRSGTGTPTVGSVRCDEVPPNASTARRLNGRNQYFKIDAAAAGLRTANHTFYIGGRFKFSWMPTGTVYFFDFGDPTTSLTGGVKRVRLCLDGSANKMFASTNNTDGSDYREHNRVLTLAPDTWHYAAAIVKANRDIELVINTQRGSAYVGSTIPPASTTLCQILQFGARGGTVTGYAPIIMGDWVWCSNFIPTDAQIDALAAGYRPDDVDGFSPTYYWPMSTIGATEVSVENTATLTATNSPPTVVGPEYLVPLQPELPRPLLMF